MKVVDRFYQEIEINTTKEAYNYIVNMCKNCPVWDYCTGADALKCNKIKDKVRKEFFS